MTEFLWGGVSRDSPEKTRKKPGKNPEKHPHTQITTHKQQNNKR